MYTFPRWRSPLRTNYCVFFSSSFCYDLFYISSFFLVQYMGHERSLSVLEEDHDTTTFGVVKPATVVSVPRIASVVL